MKTGSGTLAACHRLGACLAHAVPGVAALVTTTTGDRLLVAGNRTDAVLDACGLRAALTAPQRAGVPHLADLVSSIEIVGGLVDLGGGLYQREHGGGSAERWFVTTLTGDRVAALAATCPERLPDDAVSVRVCADTALGASAVCLVAAPGFGYRLDEVASWLLATCLVDELIGPAPVDDVERTG